MNAPNATLTPAPAKSGRTPTPQQRAIFDAVRTGTGHLGVRALAGTGKTTTAVGCFGGGAAAGDVGFCAFNKHIAVELQSRLPAGVTAMTLNAFGYRVCRQALGACRVDDRKLSNIAQELAPRLWPSERGQAEALAGMVKKTLCGTADEDFLALIDHYGLEVPDYPEDIFRLTRDMLDVNNRTTRVIDFADQIYLPYALRLPVPHFDMLLVDEAQDLNKAQQALALAATQHGRLVPIGDENQAIYGFSGADCDALPNLLSYLGDSHRGCDVFPLTVTWRCPASHVRLARAIVPSLEAAPNAPEGVIGTLDLPAIAKSAAAGDLIICRKNAPLVSLTYRLVLAGVKAIMRGRDIGRGLTSLIRRLKPSCLEDLTARLEAFREKEEARLTRKNAPESAFLALEDKCNCLGMLASQATSLDGLTTFIEKTFADEDDKDAAKGKVVLSSVHKAKGLESDRVFVLDPDSLPLRFKGARPWQHQQERNLAYVAATRAKRELYFQDEIPAIFGGA